MDTHEGGGHQSWLLCNQVFDKLNGEVKNQDETDYLLSIELTTHPVLCREMDNSRNARSAPQLMGTEFSQLALEDPALGNRIKLSQNASFLSYNENCNLKENQNTQCLPMAKSTWK